MAQQSLRHFFSYPSQTVLRNAPSYFAKWAKRHTPSGLWAMPMFAVASKPKPDAVVARLKDHADKTGIGRYEIAPIYASLQETTKASPISKTRRSLCPAGATRRYPHKLNSSSGWQSPFA